MKTVFAAYYKQIGGGRELIKFFESRQDAEVYLTSDADYLYEKIDLYYEVT